MQFLYTSAHLSPLWLSSLLRELIYAKHASFACFYASGFRKDHTHLVSKKLC